MSATGTAFVAGTVTGACSCNAPLNYTVFSCYRFYKITDYFALIKEKG
jgi:hypothetical protein